MKHHGRELSIMNELTQKIAELISTLNNGATEIGRAAKLYSPDLWRIALRQVVVEAWTFWSMWTAISALGIFFSVWLLRASLGWKASYEDCSAYTTGRNWAIALISIFTTMFIINTAHLFSIILNPEFAAASYLMNRLLEK